MSFNIGNNIGSVEGGNTTGQSYSTKCIRTYTLTTTFQANAIGAGACILAADGTNIGYKTIPITTPFMNGTYPKHLTIQNIRVTTNSTQINGGGTGIGYTILPKLPTGIYNLSSCQTYLNVQTTNMAFFYDGGATGSWGTFSDSGSYKTRLISVNQMIGTTTNESITNLYVVLWLGTTTFTPTANTFISIQVDVSFE
jgi:hypothetical protein